MKSWKLNKRILRDLVIRDDGDDDSEDALERNEYPEVDDEAEDDEHAVRRYIFFGDVDCSRATRFRSPSRRNPEHPEGKEETGTAQLSISASVGSPTTSPLTIPRSR